VLTSYLARPNTVLTDATVDGIGGPGFDLYVNLHDVQVAAHARLIVEGGPFLRIKPVLALRAGFGARFLGGPELFDPSGGFALGADADWTFAPLLGADAGVAWRFSERVEFALFATTTLAGVDEAYGVRLELSRLWF
jgi:hypothetical protein